MSPLKVQAALNYAEAYPREIDGAIEELEACDFASLKLMLPQAEFFTPRKKK